ncbi:thiamine diphosphokinase, partial [Ruminococcaceae bacterium OttesenSCG-928-A16]|nr:thiamine diphosphokinase [Ruminococcaceae bacterium OttesenSCG-928-A16]
MECVILAAQPISKALCRYIPRSAFIIAVDAGWQQAQRLGIEPDLVLGDFDSAPLPQNGHNVHRLPAEKNDTDTYFAVREALARGAQKVTILGGLGGREDHTFANLQTLRFLAENRVENLLVSQTAEIRCLWPGTVLLPPQPSRYLSVFAAGGTASGVCLRAVKYPLHNATLTPGYPLGVSNEFTNKPAE